MPSATEIVLTLHRNQEAFPELIARFIHLFIGHGPRQIGLALVYIRMALRRKDGSVMRDQITIGADPSKVPYSEFQGGPAPAELDRWSEFQEYALAHNPSLRDQRLAYTPDGLPTLPPYDPTKSTDFAIEVLDAWFNHLWEYACTHGEDSLPQALDWDVVEHAPQDFMLPEWLGVGLRRPSSYDFWEVSMIYHKLFTAQEGATAFRWKASRSVRPECAKAQAHDALSATPITLLRPRVRVITTYSSPSKPSPAVAPLPAAFPPLPTVIAPIAAVVAHLNPTPSRADLNWDSDPSPVITDSPSDTLPVVAPSHTILVPLPAPIMPLNSIHTISPPALAPSNSMPAVIPTVLAPFNTSPNVAPSPSHASPTAAPPPTVASAHAVAPSPAVPSAVVSRSNDSPTAALSPIASAPVDIAPSRPVAPSPTIIIPSPGAVTPSNVSPTFAHSSAASTPVCTAIAPSPTVAPSPLQIPTTVAITSTTCDHALSPLEAPLTPLTESDMLATPFHTPSKPGNAVTVVHGKKRSAAAAEHTGEEQAVKCTKKGAVTSKPPHVPQPSPRRLRSQGTGTASQAAKALKAAKNRKRTRTSKPKPE